jgi:hypothetical protein
MGDPNELPEKGFREMEATPNPKHKQRAGSDQPPRTAPPPMPDSPPGPGDHIMQFFKFEHLPDYLQEVSKPFALLAVMITTQLPRNPERTVALRKLLEAKDAAVRAKLATDV